MIINTQITEGNQLLATFMGGTLVEQPSPMSKRWSGLSHGKNLPESLLRYHQDYSWIMPVYEKILYEIVHIDHQVHTPEDEARFNELQHQLKMLQYSLTSPVDITKKTPTFALWQAVVAFIKWHQQEQLNPTL